MRAALDTNLLVGGAWRFCSILVGSPQLTTGISGSVEEVHQLSRLCRLFSLGAQAIGAQAIS